MHVIYKKYGPFIEITHHQRQPNPPKIRIHRTRDKHRPIGARRPDNIKRTKQICLRRVSAAFEAFGCPLLITLTFRGDASDASFANDSLRRFQVRLRDKYPSAESLFVPELSPKGRIHFHGLLFNVPMHLGDSRVGRRIVSYGTERKTRELAKLWMVGYVDVRKTNGSIRLAFYISKYITKGGNEVMFNAMRILRCSRGIPKELVIRGELAEILGEEYATENPISVWEAESPYVGRISKKLYNKK
jgi:hypothetical protein